MRKSFKLLAAALSLVLCTGLQSCQNTEEAPHGYPILFRCADVTRATVTLDDIKDSGFDVYAYFTANGSEFGFTKSLSYDTDNNVWGYNDIEYWLPGATYYFKAVYPNGIGTIDNNSPAQSLTISDFDVTTQTDLLVAESGSLTVDASIGAPTGGSIVNLQFKHQLACIVIKVSSAIDGVTINNVKLNNIANLGTYSNGNWSSNTNLTHSFASDVKLTAAAEAVDVTNGGILVIPVMTGKETITIEATNKTYSDISLPSGTEWHEGYKYTYTFEIKQNDIVFNTPSAEVWDSESAIGSVIIK